MTIPAGTADFSSEILQIERDIMSAIKSKDTVALEPMLAHEFVYRTHFGAEADKNAFLESITSFPVEIVSLRGEELRVNVYGDTAVLTGVQVAEARPPEGETEESTVAFMCMGTRSSSRIRLAIVRFSTCSLSKTVSSDGLSRSVPPRAR